MSRRNEFKSAVSLIRYGAYAGIVAGVVIVTMAASGPDPIPTLIIAGGLLIADGVWVLCAPVSAGVIPLVAALVLIGWSLQSGFVPGTGFWQAGAVIGIGCLVVSSYWRVTKGDLAGALTDVTPEELQEERLEDLVEDIRSSTMNTDPDHVQFITVSSFSRLVWDGRFRSADVVLASKDGTRPFASRIAPAPAFLVQGTLCREGVSARAAAPSSNPAAPARGCRGCP